MAFNRKLWTATLFKGFVPRYPCPRCEHGHLSLVPGTAAAFEPEHSRLDHQHEDHDATWDVERFCQRLACDQPSCVEIVHMIGSTAVSEGYYDDHYGVTDQTRETVYLPAAMAPAPPIIKIPNKVSDKAKKEITASFALFWVDAGAAANKLRSSVELILDDLKVPKVGTSKKTGKPVICDLNGRIQLPEKAEPVHAKSFNALRVIGDVGSHGSMDKDKLLDAYEIYDDALTEIFEQKKAKLEALKEKIINSKGNY